MKVRVAGLRPLELAVIRRGPPQPITRAIGCRLHSPSCVRALASLFGRSGRRRRTAVFALRWRGEC
jgi:hypothetical protein